jgi:hypothetical protein
MNRCSLLSFRSSSGRRNNLGKPGDSSSTSVGVMFMSPSSIHHIRSEHLFATDACNGCCSDVDATTGARSPPSSHDCCCCNWDCASPAFDRTTAELITQASSSAAAAGASAGGLGATRGQACIKLLGRELKIQAVENNGCWFALDSAQLELCRRLERRGLCRQVRVDVIPTREVPPRLRSLMTPPSQCCRSAAAASAASRQTANCSSLAVSPTSGSAAGTAASASSHSPLPATRIDVTQLASQHCEFIAIFH